MKTVLKLLDSCGLGPVRDAAYEAANHLKVPRMDRTMEGPAG